MEGRRKCNKCKLIKPFTEFYKNPVNKIKHDYDCKRCKNKRTVEEHKRSGFFKTPAGREAWRKASARAVKRHPEKHQARELVHAAIRSGKMKKEPCFCGKVKVHAHHPDYTKPLDVMWLCPPHHVEEHRRMKGYIH